MALQDVATELTDAKELTKVPREQDWKVAWREQSTSGDGTCQRKQTSFWI